MLSPSALPRPLSLPPLSRDGRDGRDGRDEEKRTLLQPATPSKGDSPTSTVLPRSCPVHPQGGGFWGGHRWGIFRWPSGSWKKIFIIHLTNEEVPLTLETPLSRKQQSLKEQGTLNPCPEEVTDPLFQQSNFFDSEDVVRVKPIFS
jgi:hypothetical protein